MEKLFYTIKNYLNSDGSLLCKEVISKLNQFHMDITFDFTNVNDIDDNWIKDVFAPLSLYLKPNLFHRIDFINCDPKILDKIKQIKKQYSGEDSAIKILSEWCSNSIFRPYVHNDVNFNVLKIYLKDEPDYVDRVTDNIEIRRSFETNEITGVHILNFKEILNDNQEYFS